jgi:hypothetical protein
MKRSVVVLTLLSTLATVVYSEDAAACGACAPTVVDNPSLVSGHRMVVSISAERTILWDAIEYTGNPAGFAWILPVGPGAFIELSNDSFFEALDAVTATRVLSPRVLCQEDANQETEGNGGCNGNSQPPPSAGSTGGGTPLEQGDPGDVQVLHEGALGPYETATIASDDPQALHAWLTTNGYAIPASADPIIAAYVEQKMQFIALRFKTDPNAMGIRTMTPVRVVMPGAAPTLPLRMVAIGTGARVSINLYIIAEGRYRAKGFPEAAVDPAKVEWDFVTLGSNYGDLRDQALASDGWLTAFSRQYALAEPVPKPSGVAATYATSFGVKDNLADLYFAQAAAVEGTQMLPPECEEAKNLLSIAGPGTVVSDKCEGAACPAATIGASALSCGGWDDLAAALVGQHPSDVWLTRLQANLSQSALGQDLVLEAAPTQETQESWLRAQNGTNIPCKIQGSAGATATVGGDGCSLKSPGRGSQAILLGTSLLGLLFAARRVVRRRSRR